MIYPPRFQKVMYQAFAASREMDFSTMENLRLPLDEFFHCKIVSGNVKRKCQLGNIIAGSYYSDSDLFNLCFTMNSLWSHPHNEIQKVTNSERIELEFKMNTNPDSKDNPTMPNYSYPIGFSIQLAVHSPYAEANPFLFGENFIAGKAYQIKLEQNERHLLPPPYQTNCTNYLAAWYERGGKGPLDQRMVNEECKFNRSLERLGCVPFSVDYPHNETVCRYRENYPGFIEIIEECMIYSQRFSQPCFQLDYDVKIEEKYINERMIMKSTLLNLEEVTVNRIKGYNCSFEQAYRQRCKTVSVEIVFDGFQITNLTYSAKYESMELFSVLGGYMGMYLGVSIVAVYDFGEMIVIAFHSFLAKRRALKKKNRGVERRQFQKKNVKKDHRNEYWNLNEGL